MGIKQLYEVDLYDDDDLKDFITQRAKSKQQYKPGYEKHWLDTIALYHGVANASYDTYAREFIAQDIPAWRKNLAINLLLPIVRSSVAKHLRNRPIWDVIPASDNIEDINIAYEGRKTLQAYWYKYNFNYQFIDLLLWLALTGNAFLYIYWDPNEGIRKEYKLEDFIDLNLLQRAQNEEEIALVLSDANEKFTVFSDINNGPYMPIGEPVCKVISPFDVLFPWTDKIENAEWVIITQSKDISSYADLGIDPSKLTEIDYKDTRYSHYQPRYQNLFALPPSIAPMGNTGVNTPTPDTQILEYQLWIKPCRKYPKGFIGVDAGGMVINKSEIPYNHQRYPIVHFTEQKLPSKAWGFSKAAQAIPLINQYANTINRVIESQELMSHPKVLVSSSSRIPTNAWTSRPGEIVEYKGIIAPQPWVPPPIPQDTFQVLGLLRKDTDDIVAQRDATKGYNPPGVRSAVALENLQSADEGELAIAGLILDTSFSVVGRLLLSVIDQFTKEPRILSYESENRLTETVNITPNNLSGKTIGADYFNVRVTQFSQFGLNRSGQLEFLTVLLQYNIFGPQDRDKILKFISMGYFADEIDEHKIDRTNAHIENLMMAKGQLDIAPKPYDHHTTHKEEHLRFLKENGNRLPPNILQAFIFHLNLTKFFEVQDAVEPQILAQKAQLVVAAEQGILPLILGMNNVGQSRDKQAGNTKPKS